MRWLNECTVTVLPLRRIVFIIVLLWSGVLAAPGVYAHDHRGTDLYLGATNDTFRAAKYAPALLAWRPHVSGAIELSQAGDFSIRNADFYFSSENFSYTLSVLGDGDIEHGPTIAYNIADVVGFGVHADFGGRDISDTDLRVHLVARPSRHLSISAQYQLIDVQDSRITASLGIRPFTNSWNHRLTLGVGGAYNVGGSVELPAFTLSTELIDGVLFDFGYSLQRNRGFVTIGVAHDSLTTGVVSRVRVPSSSTAEVFDGVSYWVEGSLHKRRSYVNTPLNHTVRFSDLQLTEETRISPDSLLYRFEYDQQLLDVLASVKQVCSNPRTTGVIFENVHLRASLPQVEELVIAFQECKERGKPIVFYGAHYSYAAYLLAAAIADEIILHPSGTVDIRGIAAYRFYLKELADMFGIKLHVYKAHEYKNGLDIFAESAMSSEEREALQVALTTVQERINGILGNRAEQFAADARTIVEEGGYLIASVAERQGVVDTVLLPMSWKSIYWRLVNTTRQSI